MDELKLIKGLRFTDIFSIAFCITCLLDILAWVNPNVISGLADLILAFVMLALSISAIKGAEKWNY